MIFESRDSFFSEKFVDNEFLKSTNDISKFKEYLDRSFTVADDLEYILKIQKFAFELGDILSKIFPDDDNDDAAGSVLTGDLSDSNEFSKIGLYVKSKILFCDVFGCSDTFSPIDVVDLDDIDSKSTQKFVNFSTNFIKNTNLKNRIKYSPLSFSINNDQELFDYFEHVYECDKDKIFALWKKQFYLELGNSIFRDNVFEYGFDKSGEILVDLSHKYPKAKPNLLKHSNSKSKLNNLKSKFIEKEKTKLFKDFDNIIKSNSDFFHKLKLRELFLFSGFFKEFIEKVDLKYDEKFKEDLEEYFKAKFEESHNSSQNRESQKESAKNIEQKLNLLRESKDDEYKTNQNVVERKELPQGLIDKLNEYFGGKIDPDLERSLRNSGGFYKSSWFDRFGVDDGFFKILSSFGFICEDISEEEIDENPVGNVGSDSDYESQSDSGIEIDDNFSKLKNLIENIKSTDVIESKVDYYIQAFQLFYDIKDVQIFKTQMLNSIKYDIRVLKGVDLVLYKILNGQKEEIKTSGMNKRKRYFRFDLGYNTGYRIVIQDQDGSNRRIIVDFVDHDTYSDNISNYLKSF